MLWMFITTEQVWNVFHTPLLQFIRTRVADDSSAEDILQEVLLKLHRELKDVKKLESWVYQITRHTMIDFYRNKEQPKASLDATEVLGLAEDLPDDDVITDLFPAVRAMVKSLPEQDRQAWCSQNFRGQIARAAGTRETQTNTPGVLSC
jgi:RNA polymerase sigma-70 factor (ECF subfamily)